MATIDALTGPSLMPRAGKAPTSVVILVHGYGANGADLIGLAPAFAEDLPETAFYSPNAPQQLGGFAGAYQWFALDGFDPAAMGADSNRMIDVYRKMGSGTAQAAGVLNQYIDQVLAAHNLGADRLALVGFSQGTMMSLHVGLRRPKQIAGILGFSGALTGADVLASQVVTRPPVALVHGSADPILPVQSMAEAARVLKSIDVPVMTHVVAGLQHGIDGEAAHYGTTFLKKHLG